MAAATRASASTLSRIYYASLANLPAAIRTFDSVEIFDNAAFGQRTRLVSVFQEGQRLFLSPQIPPWLNDALRNTEFAPPPPNLETK